MRGWRRDGPTALLKSSSVATKKVLSLFDGVLHPYRFNAHSIYYAVLASTRISKKLCPSVSLSVCPSLGRNWSKNFFLSERDIQFQFGFSWKCSNVMNYDGIRQKYDKTEDASLTAHGSYRHRPLVTVFFLTMARGGLWLRKEIAIWSNLNYRRWGSPLNLWRGYDLYLEESHWDYFTESVCPPTRDTTFTRFAALLITTKVDRSVIRSVGDHCFVKLLGQLSV